MKFLSNLKKTLISSQLNVGVKASQECRNGCGCGSGLTMGQCDGQEVLVALYFQILTWYVQYAGPLKNGIQNFDQKVKQFVLCI